MTYIFFPEISPYFRIAELALARVMPRSGRKFRRLRQRPLKVGLRFSDEGAREQISFHQLRRDEARRMTLEMQFLGEL